MTTTVQEFISDNPPVVTATLNDNLLSVLKRMIEHDYSQIPVVSDDQKPIGILTSDSVLRALRNYMVTLEGVGIRHAMEKDPETFSQDIDLFDLFDKMQNSYALVVDDNELLVGIVTSYDVTEYFHQRAQDILLVENIEGMLKDYIQAAFASTADGEEKLNQAIQSMTNSTMALRQKFDQGLRNYLGAADGQTPRFSEELAEEVFTRYFDDDRPPAAFDDLSLGHYISLFFHNDYWATYEPIFGLNKRAIENLMNSVRRTRNDLAHFREISRDQSYQLRDCYNLLTEHQDAILQAFDQEEEIEIGEQQATSGEDVDGDDFEPLEDEPAAGESRYAPLAIWLQGQPPEKKLVKPTFTKVEEIIDGPLPESAYNHRAWWSNDSVGHSQSRQWLEVGWRIASVNMDRQVVRFARIKEREKAYIDFYSALVHILSEHDGFEHVNKRPDGASWHQVGRLSVHGRLAATFNFAFGRGGVFRDEIYIDSGDQTINKQIFDGLYEQKEQIENELGHELRWQRLDKKRASRISLIFRGHITDSEEELDSLRQKAAPAMVSFIETMRPRAETVAKEVL